jgi:hydrogenase/urease accessory protein HupE
LKRLAIVVVALVALLLGRTAEAHVIGVSIGDYTPDGSQVAAVLTMRADDALLAVPGLDSDGDGVVSAAELERAGPALKAAFVDALVVEADGARCPGLLVAAAEDAPDGLRMTARYACADEPARLRLRFGFLERMPSDHRHLATVHLPRGDVDALAVLSRAEIDVDVGGGPSRGFVSFVRSGVEHILTGADHLAFLVALLLGGTLVADRRTRVGALVTMLTAFTVGHSVSLAVATIGGYAPAARFVEPAVALSVAYVGAENLFTRSVSHRWMLTLAFGFVHGFAFAGGLIPLGLPRAQLPLALAGFNLGVEAGQLLVLAVLLPLLTLCRPRGWYAKAARALSVVIVLAGVVWFVERVARGA